MALNIQTIENQSMKYLIILLNLTTLPFTLNGQGISIEAENESKELGSGSFPMNGSVLQVSGERFLIGDQAVVNPLAWSVSKEWERLAFLQNRGGVELQSFNSSGDVLYTRALDFFDPSDETLSVFQFADGKVILRDNVANFTFLNSRGETAYSVSNSSGSLEGEKESMLAADALGNTVILFNPVIAGQGGTGSRAQIIFGDRDAVTIFRSNREEIRDVNVHHEGRFISIITNLAGGSAVYLYDRLGNELYQSRLEEDIIGVTLSDDAQFITAFSSGRMQVYNIISGEREGSASSRSSILYAKYDEASQAIVALGGVRSGLTIEEPEITAVSLAQRKIEREAVPYSLSMLEAGRLDLLKTDANRYRLTGLNRTLLLEISF
jgi:hypothetical protein